MVAGFLRSRSAAAEKKINIFLLVFIAQFELIVLSFLYSIRKALKHFIIFPKNSTWKWVFKKRMDTTPLNMWVKLSEEKTKLLIILSNKLCTILNGRDMNFFLIWCPLDAVKYPGMAFYINSGAYGNENIKLADLNHLTVQPFAHITHWLLLFYKINWTYFDWVNKLRLIKWN